MEQTLVDRAGLKIEAIPAAGLRGKNPVAFVRGLWALAQGYRHSWQIIRSFQPEVLFVTGGYVCVPMTLAARQSGIPVIIYLPDVEPGLAIKFLARFADRVAVTTAEAQTFFKSGQTVVTGYPVRAELFAMQKQGQTAARQELDLFDDLPVLLVFGGSRGARSINQAITAQIEDYLQVCQVVHVTGTLDEKWVWARWAELPEALQARYHLWAYLHDKMIPALIAADLVVSRAGASIMGEYPAAGLPAILVPYPYAGAHQTLNAQYLVKHQAAVVVKNADLPEKLKPTVLDLLTDQKRLAAMNQACLSLAKPDAALRLAQEILEVQHGRN
jgi:UDP-N-acetylglucosamine--N-acetylmuramyl-(pentapeptide) pyrophosphoryl-undecaprenol N-acetylglucosamine transferase